MTVERDGWLHHEVFGDNVDDCGIMRLDATRTLDGNGFLGARNPSCSW